MGFYQKWTEITGYKSFSGLFFSYCPGLPQIMAIFFSFSSNCMCSQIFEPSVVVPNQRISCKAVKFQRNWSVVQAHPGLSSLPLWELGPCQHLYRSNTSCVLHVEQIMHECMKTARLSAVRNMLNTNQCVSHWFSSVKKKIPPIL